MSDTTTPDELVKQPWEKREFCFDFAALMVEGEEINSNPSPSITSEFIGGGPSDLVIETVAIVGQTVTFWISGGTHAKRYKVECRIYTSAGQQLEVDGILRIRD